MNSASHNTYLVVGLGNPGGAYSHTRHNAGYEVVDILAERYGVRYWKTEAGCEAAEIAASRIGAAGNVILAKPQTFMNVSGGPVAKIAKLHHVDIDHIIVVHDDLERPASTCIIKAGGGHGGHNGLRSIIEKMRSGAFMRVRCGIGRPPGKMDPATFVLQPLKGAQKDDFDIMCQQAADLVEQFLSGQSGM